MAAGTYDILVEQGATFSLDMIVKSQPSTAYPTGQAVDLSDVVIRAQIRPSSDSNLILAEFQGSVGTPPEAGVIVLTIPAQDTAKIDATNYTDAVYDVILTFPNGMVRRLIQGNVQISPGVTR